MAKMENRVESKAFFIILVLQQDVRWLFNLVVQNKIIESTEIIS